MPVLARKVAVVTGAGGGIGRACGLALARAGAYVVCGDINFAAAEESMAEIRSAGGEAEAFHVDVSDPELCAEFVERAVRQRDRLDVLFHSAGISHRRADVVDIKNDEWQAVVSTNLTGTFYICRDVARNMIKQSSGSIVLMGSGRALYPGPGLAAYAASKGGLLAFTRALAHEVGEHGITVNAIVPGYTDTPLLRKARSDADIERLRRLDPMLRLGKPEDVAEMLVFLCAGGREITGQVHLLRDYMPNMTGLLQ